MKTEVLYDDRDICLEKFEDGNYRVSVFREDNHWHGDFTFNKDGIKYDDLSEEMISLEKAIDWLKFNSPKYFNVVGDCGMKVELKKMVEDFKKDILIKK